MADTEVIKRRLYGGVVEYKTIEANELKAHQPFGWVKNSDPLPEPVPPDVEVLELKVRDAKRELERVAVENRDRLAEAIARHADAENKLERAMHSLQMEPEVKAEMQKQRDRETAVEKVVALFKRMGDRPVSERVLLGQASNPDQERHIRETFVTNSYFIGRRDEAGDLLYVLNKQDWLAKESQRKEAEEKEKEAKIRARMEVK